MCSDIMPRRFLADVADYNMDDGKYKLYVVVIDETDDGE